MTKYFLGQWELPAAELGLKAVTAAAPSLMSVFGGGSGNQTDPAGAARQQQFQAQEAQMAVAQQQALLAVTAPKTNTSLTKWLIFGGAGLVVLGTVGLLAYKHIKEE